MTKAGVERSDAPPPSARLRRDARRARAARAWRMPVIPTVIAVLCILGAGLLQYPSIAAWFSQYEQSQRIDGYSDGIRDLGAGTLRQELERAREYNAEITGGADVAANERLPLARDTEDASAYDSVLAADADGLMARLKIPSVQIDLPIYHGTSETVLRRGVGHLQGTALPVGGASTHSVLTAHRGLATSELFTHLDRVEVDDTFTVEVFGEVLTYRVVRTVVVQPEDTEALLPQAGRDLMTLVTCTPLGVNSHRILVTGERVIPTPQQDLDDAGKRPDIPTFPWWVVISAAVISGAVLYIWLSGRPARPRLAESAGSASGVPDPSVSGVPDASAQGVPDAPAQGVPDAPSPRPDQQTGGDPRSG
ncbi:class C sortase [Microbacterium invictum]|uniref:Class C sortase n=1 Tax=Microbacterium invictum TaxID=515415 RepID=A0ABZ0VB05_9MICO|nr:class C sortase [Microbacterium invictum]WQB69992.1 class C sortase [Microbacterium invictum]